MGVPLNREERQVDENGAEDNPEDDDRQHVGLLPSLATTEAMGTDSFSFCCVRPTGSPERLARDRAVFPARPYWRRRRKSLGDVNHQIGT